MKQKEEQLITKIFLFQLISTQFLDKQLKMTREGLNRHIFQTVIVSFRAHFVVQKCARCLVKNLFPVFFRGFPTTPHFLSLFSSTGSPRSCGDVSWIFFLASAVWFVYCIV